jgi:hypothetical protein
MVFKKTFGAIKSFVSNSVNNARRGILNHGPRLLNVSQKGLGMLASIPGTIGTAAKVANSGINTLRKMVEQIPNDSAKSTLTSYIDKGQNVVNTVQEKLVNKGVT